MENKADRLEAALGDDITAVLTAELDQDSRSAQLSGLWDARISDETYCKYLRLNQEGFLSSFGICAIAASFSLMVVVYTVMSGREDDVPMVLMMVYDGESYS